MYAYPTVKTNVDFYWIPDSSIRSNTVDSQKNQMGVSSERAIAS